MSQESSDMPADFGTHHCLNRSGLLHASKTICSGASNVRVTTSSRSDLRSTLVAFLVARLLSLLWDICLLLAFQVFDKFVQGVEASAPDLAVTLDPGRFFLHPARSEL